jgi:RNA polymerase sigma-70 factor (ECF subfamily)
MLRKQSKLNGRARPGSGEPLTEKQLVLAFKAGQEDAYSEIYRRNRAMVEHICRRLLKNPDDAQEATQETMVRVLQGLPQFNGRYLLQAWVARIATNVCLDVLRAKGRRHEAEPLVEDFQIAGETHATPAAQLADPSEQVIKREESDRIMGVLSDLPAHHRDALVLREFQGLSHKEIGARLGMSTSQVKALIHRAKRSFRHAWNGAGHRRVSLGLTLPAFLAKMRPPRFLRRLVWGVADQAGQAASNPSVAAVTSGGAERVAAAITVAVVAGASLGTVAAVSHAPARPPAQVAQAAASPSPTPTLAVPVVKLDFVKPKKVRVAPKAAAPVAPVAAAPSPTLPAPTPTVPAQPSPTPSADPTTGDGGPSAVPPSAAGPPPPPPFKLTAVSDVTPSYRCGCGARPEESSTVGETPDGQVAFTEQVGQAALHDTAGVPTWPLSLSQSSQDGLNHSLQFSLTNANGTFSYAAQGHRVYLLRDGDTWTLGFQGTYAIASGSADDTADLPQQGFYELDLTVSRSTNRITEVSLTLDDRPSN